MRRKRADDLLYMWTILRNVWISRVRTVYNIRVIHRVAHRLSTLRPHMALDTYNNFIYYFFNTKKPTTNEEILTT